MFQDLLKALGWQGGTIHQAISEFAKLKHENEIMKKRLEIATDSLRNISTTDLVSVCQCCALSSLRKIKEVN